MLFSSVLAFCHAFSSCMVEGRNCSCALKRLSLKINQHSWAPGPSWAASHDILPSRSTKSKKYNFLKSTAEVLKFALLTSQDFKHKAALDLYIPRHRQKFSINCLLPYRFQVKVIKKLIRKEKSEQYSCKILI